MALTWMALLVLATGVPNVAHAAPAKKPSFAGSYELAGKHSERVFTMEIQTDGHRATLSFSASMADGSGSAPDADGTGKIDDDGVLTFKFKDSYDNEGTGKLRFLPSTELYQLDMAVTKVVDPAPLHFYGTLQLKKTSDRPAKP